MKGTKMNLLNRLMFWVKTGTPIQYLGKCEEYQIRFKDIYIQVLEGEDTWSVSWSNEPLSHLPVRDIITVALQSTEDKVQLDREEQVWIGTT